MRQRPTSRYGDFEVAIICTDGSQFNAIIGSIDEFLHPDGIQDGIPDREDFKIRTGRIGKHSIVLALLYHVAKAGAVPKAAIWSRFTALKLVILAGSCGGVPFINHGQDEVLLGDVIINDLATHYKFIENGGLVQSRQRRRGPSQLIENSRNFFAIFHTAGCRDDLQERTAYYLYKLQEENSGISTYYKYPRAAEDKLFKSCYRHKHHGSVECVCSNCHGKNDPVCEKTLDSSCHDLGCNEKYLVVRKRKQVDAAEGQKPALHIGRIASVDTVMRSGEDRDKVAEAEDVIAFEMGGVWRWEGLPCIMVRGVCGYADGHMGSYERSLWQYYAAATAASAIKAVLERYPHTDRDQGHHVEGLRRGHFLVPIKRNPIFTGRETILSKLLEKIPPGANKDDCQRIAIKGPEGIGKTQVALEAAYLVHEKHPDCSIFWVSAIDSTTFDNYYYDIGKTIGTQGIDEDGADVKRLVKTALSEETSGSWLLIIDDADALELFGLSVYLPFSRNGSILFTTRNYEAMLYIPEESIFPVDALDIGEALDLTQKFLTGEQTSYTRGTKSLSDFLELSTSNYENQGRWTEDEKLEKQLIEVFRESLGDEDPETISSMHRIASTYQEFHRDNAARMLERRVIKARRGPLRNEPPGILASIRNLASIYEKQGRWGKAEKLYKSVIDICRTMPGLDHPGTLTSMHDLAAIYMDQGRQEEAKMLSIQILEVHKTKLALLNQHPPSKSELKEVEGDSGYGSTSHQAPTTIPSLPDLQNDIDTISSPEKGEVEDNTPIQSDDDIRSAVSDNDDIRSQISDATTSEGITGKALIRAFLAEQPHFKALCEKALARMDRQRFTENMSRLLKSFHIWLAEEAKSEAEKAVAGLLRSRRGRRRISEQLAAHIDLEHEEARDFGKETLEIPPSKMQDVENWISQAMKPSEPEDLELIVDQDQYQGQDSDSEDADEPHVFPYLSELKSFLLTSKAFQNLQMRFALMFLSADLGYMLQSIPRENIRLSQEQDISTLNRFKTLVENTTKVRWNWWPLSPRKRMLKPGESRLFWQCTCGAEQWEEISPEQREVVERILEWSGSNPPLASRCGVRKAQAAILSNVKGIVRYTSDVQVTQPPPAYLNTPPHGTGTSFTSQPKGPAAPTPLGGQRGPATGQQAQVAISKPTDNQQWWILFGVKGARRTLVPTQIRVIRGATDSYIFQELKRCYKTYRGRLRLWFSVWRLDYCEVVKFSRLTPDRIVREHRDLPSDKDYHYDPRAGEQDARNPPISPHLFQILFYACCSPCTWPFPHDCIHLLDTYNLTRIPKRTREFERDPSSPIWGFETVFAVSFSYVLAYHCVMVAGPFIFWGLWLKFHPDDLQNASVPTTVVLSALSLFWSGAGILTSGSKE